MKAEKKRVLEHCLRILQVEFPDAHPYTLALKAQVQTGYEIRGQQVRQFLTSGSLETPSYPHDL